MTMNDAGQRMAEAIDGKLGKISIGALTTLTVAIGMWLITAAIDNGTKITKVSTSVDDLTASIIRHDHAEDDAIHGLISAEYEQARNLAALEQALKDAEKRLELDNKRQDDAIGELRRPGQ